jgi:hypothetical protein
MGTGGLNLGLTIKGVKPKRVLRRDVMKFWRNWERGCFKQFRIPSK